MTRSPFNRVTKSGAGIKNLQSGYKQGDNQNIKLVSDVAKLQQTAQAASANKDASGSKVNGRIGIANISAFKAEVVKDGVSPFRSNRSYSIGNTFQSKGANQSTANIGGSEMHSSATKS